LKFQSVEKGLVKSAMLAAAEKRKLLKDELLKVEEKRQQDRTQVASEYEDVTLANEIVNKRRNKSLRKGSITPSGASSTAPASSSSSNQQKVSRRQSAKRTSVPNALVSSQPVPGQVEQEQDDEEDDSQSNPIHHTSSSTLPIQPEGVHSSIPPAYQKLLQMGLSQEQVRPCRALPFTHPLLISHRSCIR
jgi:hypothetical protein